MAVKTGHISGYTVIVCNNLSKVTMLSKD